MGGSIGPDKIAGLAIGGDLVAGAAMGDTVFYRAVSFARQRMNKSGNFTVPSGGSPDVWRHVTGWASDSTYPATISSNELVVQGGPAAVTITASCQMAANWQQRNARLLVNGNVVDTSNRSGNNQVVVHSLSWSGTVAPGDLIRLEAAAGASTAVNATNTWIDVTPT